MTKTITADEIRELFSQAMSGMYQQEVPQYGTLLELVADVNLAILENNPALHEQLLSNLKLAMLVFFSSDVPSARRLRRNKHRFRILNRRYSHAHVERLHQQNVQSIETSSLHLGLLGDMKRLNSLFCAVAYSVMEQPDEDDDRDEY